MTLWLIGLHLLATLSVFLSALTLVFQLVISVLIGISLIFHLKHSNRAETIQYSSDDGWFWLNSRQEICAIDILSTTVITLNIIVFNFKTQNNKTQTIFICKDSLLKDEYRRLQVILKIMPSNKKVEMG